MCLMQLSCYIKYCHCYCIGNDHIHSPNDVDNMDKGAPDTPFPVAPLRPPQLLRSILRSLFGCLCNSFLRKSIREIGLPGSKISYPSFHEPRTSWLASDLLYLAVLEEDHMHVVSSKEPVTQPPSHVTPYI